MTVLYTLIAAFAWVWLGATILALTDKDFAHESYWQKLAVGPIAIAAIVFFPVTAFIVWRSQRAARVADALTK